MLDGWNKRSGDAVAAPFAEDGDLVGFDGGQLTGRAEIASVLQQIFADHPTAAYVGKVRSVRLLAPEVAVLRAVAGMVPPGQSDLEPQLNSVQTLDAAKRDGQWRIALFQNTPAQFHVRPELVQKLTEELRQLLSLYTIHSHASVLRALTHWAYEENYFDEDPFEHLPVPKVPKLEKEILTDEEINRIFERLNPATQQGKRLRTMITLLLDTGIRAGEFLGLTVDNVNIEEGSIKVFGKGRKERMVPIGLTTQKELMTYLQFHRPQPAHPDISNVFLAKNGFPLTSSGLCSIIKRLKKRTGIERLHISSGILLTLMIERNIPAFVVQQIAGHSSIKTTEIYMRLAQRRTNLRYQRNSVMDGLRILQRRPVRRDPSRSK